MTVSPVPRNLAPILCRHRGAPQHVENLAGSPVFRVTKTSKRRYRVKCTECGRVREVGSDMYLTIAAINRTGSP